MVRERVKVTGSSLSDEDKGQRGRKGRKKAVGGSKNNGRPKQQIIPNWCLAIVLFFLIFLRFSIEHYKKTRSLEAFHESPVSIHQTEDKRAIRSSQSKSSSTSGKSFLSPEDDKTLEYDKSGQRYHLIFSTDCSPYQHWQSYLVYFTAMQVKQPGHVTRIVSGCEPDEEKAMVDWFNHHIQFMSQRFHLHLTPEFSKVRDEEGNVTGDYKFFNKPFGLKHFLENFDILQFRQAPGGGGTFGIEDDVVILIDPDMPLMRPITSDFSDERETLIAAKRKGDKQLSTKVKHGTPFAQTYGLGTQWQKFDLDEIAGPDSPAKDVKREEGALYYPVGPPYLGTVKDMYQIAFKWTEFVPKVHAQYPYLLAEMYAFCIAAAHLNLRFQLIDSLMVSNPGTGGEAWPLVNKIPREEMCDFARDPDNSKYALPSVVHLCQRYSVGEEWFFGKRRIPPEIYDCATPLFEEPPSDLALLYDFKKPPNAKVRITRIKPVFKYFPHMAITNLSYLYGVGEKVSQSKGNQSRGVHGLLPYHPPE